MLEMRMKKKEGGEGRVVKGGWQGKILTNLFGPPYGVKDKLEVSNDQENIC